MAKPKAVGAAKGWQEKNGHDINLHFGQILQNFRQMWFFPSHFIATSNNCLFIPFYDVKGSNLITWNIPITNHFPPFTIFLRQPWQKSAENGSKIRHMASFKKNAKEYLAALRNFCKSKMPRRFLKVGIQQKYFIRHFQVFWMKFLF